MRAFIKFGLDKNEAAVSDLVVPHLVEGQVLLKVEACGLCGSDIHAWRSDKGYEWVAPPIVLGHEFVGTIVEVSPSVRGWKVGDRAVVVSIQGCLNCDECLQGRTERCPTRRVIGLSYDGAMAEYVAVSSDFLVRFPHNVSAAIGAAVEPLSVAAHATITVARVEAGQKVVVSGAGFVGIGCALLAKNAGAEVILIGAPRDAAFRLPAAAALGIDTRTTEQANWGSPDIWIEASGAPNALATAIKDTYSGGLVSVVGLYAEAPSADLNFLVRREIQLKGSYASVASEYELIIEMLKDGLLPVEPLLQKFSLEDSSQAFLAAEQSRTLKPIIMPPET
jgi:L-iditol 2-dehydrogenase